tara:strand:- start:608 stop:1108 length:501 start_codon:yes stop_codon:yes gene_type:complete
MKHLLIVVGLVFGLTTAYGGPDKGPKKHRGKGKPTPEQVEAFKAKWEAAKKKRDKKRGDAKKRGSKHRGPRGEFGKLVRDDAKIKELKEAFEAAAKKLKGKVDRNQWKDATDEEKAALRDKIKANRKEWEAAMKAHRVEVGKRIREIREEFKNNRDKVIDGNKPGE